MDKLKKIIYIVSGTLGIILMMFLLMHKVGLCAPAGFTGYPLPYGAGSRIGYGSYDLTEEKILSVLELALAYEPTWFTNGYIVTVNEVDEVNNTIKLRVAGLDSNNSNAVVDFRGEYDYLSSSSSIGLQRNKVLEYRINADGTISRTYSGSGNSTQYAQIGGHILTDVQSREIYIPYDEFIGNYPVYFSDNVNLSYNGNVIFKKMDPPHSMGGGEGSITNLPTQEQMSGSPSSGDDTSTLFGLLKGWLGAINNNNWAIAENQNDNMESFFKPYLDRIVSFTDWVFEPLDKEQLEDEFTSTEIYGLGSFVHSTGGDIAEFVTDGPPVPQGLHFDCQLHLLNKTFPFTVDFSWYENIKTQFLTVFLTFFYIGALIYFLKAIPSLLNGVSGQYNHIQEVSKKGDKK